MSFLKETDYHGSRRYDGPGSTHVLLDHLRLRLSLGFAWAGLKVEKWLRLGAASPRTASLIDHGHKHFSSLGERPRAVPARRPITEIFPIPASVDRPRKPLKED